MSAILNSKDLKDHSGMLQDSYGETMFYSQGTGFRSLFMLNVRVLSAVEFLGPTLYKLGRYALYAGMYLDTKSAIWWSHTNSS